MDKGRNPNIFIERFFPIREEKQGHRVRMRGEVPWAVAELAYANHQLTYGTLPVSTLQEIADNGGWTWSVLLRLLCVPGVNGPLPISPYVGNGGKRNP